MAVKTNQLMAYKRRKIIWSYIFLTPQLTLYLALTILPFFIALPLLFTDQTNFLDTEVNHIGWANFTRIFNDPLVRDTFWPALGRTLVFTVVHFGIALVFGLALALLMYEVGFKGGVFTIIYLPYMISGFALGFIALALFSQSTGTVNLLLERGGLLDTPLDIKRSSGTTFILPILVGWRAAGFYMAIFLSGLLAIPTETIEASIVDGANYLQRLLRIYFPQMVPSFLIVTTFVIFRSFNLFDELVPLGGLYQNEAAEFISIVFYKYAFVSDRLALGMTMAVETFIPLFLIGLFLQRFQRRTEMY